MCFFICSGWVASATATQPANSFSPPCLSFRLCLIPAAISPSQWPKSQKDTPGPPPMGCRGPRLETGTAWRMTYSRHRGLGLFRSGRRRRVSLTEGPDPAVSVKVGWPRPKLPRPWIEKADLSSSGYYPGALSATRPDVLVFFLFFFFLSYGLFLSIVF